MTLAGAAGVLLLSAAPASAVPFTVNSPADTSDAAPGNGACATPAAGPPVCTLCAAVEETNALAGADTINLPTGRFAVLSPSPATEFGDLRVTDHLTIDGAGPGATVIEGLGPEGVFFFTGTLNVTLRDLQITGGEDDFGAALQFQAGELTMERVDVSGNTGTGTNPEGIVALAAAFGTANATIRDSTFRNNTVGTTAGDGVIAQQAAVGGNLSHGQHLRRQPGRRRLSRRRRHRLHAERAVGYAHGRQEHLRRQRGRPRRRTRRWGGHLHPPR